MKISVVIPMFNASGIILRCLNALAAQEVLPDEVILVDNNSTDGSKAVVESAQNTLKGLNIKLCEEPKSGPSAARNKGAGIAVGDVIAFTDSDCIPDRSWIKNILAVFTQNKDLGAVGGIDKSSIPADTVMGKFLSAFWVRPDYCSQSLILQKEDFFDGQVIITFNCAFNRDFFKKINGFDETFKTGEDIDITLRAVDAGGKIIAWNKDMAVCHLQDICIKSLLRREFHYAKGLVLNVDRHFRNNIFVCLPHHKHYHWPNKTGLTVVLMANVAKIFLLMLVLLAAAFISPILLGLMFLLFCVYFCLEIRKLVRNNGSDLTLQETLTALFIYFVREMSEYYGRIYWSFKYKVICM